MIKKISNLGKDELVRGSTILFMMIVLYNLFNYIFQLSMAKLLGPADYGILAVLMSIVYIFSIPSEAIQTIITKYVSIFSSKNENGKIKDIFMKSIKKGLFFASILFVIYIIFSMFLSSFLNIDNTLLIITGIFIFLVFIIPAVRGVMQGTKKFFALGMNMIIESVSKLIISVLLAIFGWKVYGSIIGVLLGSVFAFLMGSLSLNKIMKTKSEKLNSLKIYQSNISIVVATLSIVLMYSIDIILARRFFSPELAGQYAFVSLIGKVIIFVSSAIGKAMLPISTGEFEGGVKNNNTLKKSLIIVSLMSIISLLLYSLIPEFIVRVISLGSTVYIEASHILFNLGLAYSLISISYIIVLFKISQNKLNKSSAFLFIFVLIQIVILSIYHNTIYEYSLAMLFSSLLMFLYSLFLIRK